MYLLKGGGGGGSIRRLDPAVDDEDRQVSFGATGGEAGGAASERAGQPLVAATNFVRPGRPLATRRGASRVVPLTFGSGDTVLPIVDRRSQNVSQADLRPPVRGWGFDPTEDDAQFVREVFALIGLVERWQVRGDAPVVERGPRVAGGQQQSQSGM